MSPLNALIFGLGLFFLGLRLVGDNLRGLAGGSLKSGFARTSHNPWLGGGLGLLAGGLMQSATAVTFICVSMVAAGLFTTGSAAVVIVWSNVGLTALAFVATLNIHPLVALVVGGAGIVMGVIRNRAWQTAAGVFLGMGLILLGLQQMGEGAAPLQEEAWFRHGIDFAVSSAPMAFLAGVLAAAILQSNTGATMMVITLAGAGALAFPSAALMIYGTNLGAIALRFVLAAGMKGDGLRLVRLEDLFCLWSGVLMLVLYYVEQAGVPLIFALAHAITPAPEQALAVVFTLSNLLPALLLMPCLPAFWKLLLTLWPGEPPVRPGKPKFLVPQALSHPGVALDLLRRELARLLTFMPAGGAPEAGRKPSGGDEVDEPGAAFVRLSGAIEEFAIKLAARGDLTEKQMGQLQQLRAVLSGIRHLEEAVRFYRNRRVRMAGTGETSATGLDNTLDEFLERLRQALDGADGSALQQLLEESKRHGPTLTKVRKAAFGDGVAPGDVETPALVEDFELVAWTYHRLVKNILRLPSLDAGFVLAKEAAAR
jgi:phosphate:Na+ symporter